MEVGCHKQRIKQALGLCVKFEDRSDEHQCGWTTCEQGVLSEMRLEQVRPGKPYRL